MCEQWKKKLFNKYSCDGVITDKGNGEFVVKGQLKHDAVNSKILYYASNPPTYCTSYSGSGLPFPNPVMAFENTPNKGAIMTNANGEFKFKVQYPNSYYAGLGTVHVEPQIFLKICGEDKIHTVKLGNGIPFRLLSYPGQRNLAPRTGPNFYKRQNLAIRTQEQIFRDSTYPSKNIMPKNFWGKVIPHS